jgi:hypothetical protein
MLWAWVVSQLPGFQNSQRNAGMSIFASRRQHCGTCMAEKTHCSGIVAVNVIPVKFAVSEIFPTAGYDQSAT